ncbi:MAG: hypothetical protein WCY34_06365 [Candidatus Omnitrophota bacterium]|jgi:hypothetical protein
MFTESDYRNYFSEIEGALKDSLVIYTDLLNELSNKAIYNKLYSIVSENMDAFRFIKDKAKNFNE